MTGLEFGKPIPRKSRSVDLRATRRSLGWHPTGAAKLAVEGDNAYGETCGNCVNCNSELRFVRERGREIPRELPFCAYARGRVKYGEELIIVTDPACVQFEPREG